ncbi:calcium channel protein [Haplosporangium sp. Z 27]|nr:calcium channel protein [Haplosporangium sp. Z 27]
MEAALPWHQVAIAALFMIAFYSFANCDEEEKHRKQQRHFIRTLNCTPLEKHKLKFYLKNYLEPRSHDKEQVEQLETEEQVAKQEVKRKEILYCEKLYREYTYRLLPLRLTPAPELGSGPAPGSDSTQDSSCSSFLVRNSLFIFKPNNKIRNSLQLIIRPIRGRRLEGVEHNANYSRVFHFIIFLAIIASLVTAAITTPVWHLKQSKLNPDDQSNTITVSNLIFPIIFTVEFLMRVIADGFMFTPDAYMKSFWNVLDLFVLVSMYIPIITNASDTQGYSRVLRSFKSLRVLRVINLSEYAKDTLYTVLIAGFPQLFNAAALCLCLLVPFAIYGMHLFSGKFFSCNDGDASVVTLQDCMGTFANNNNVTMPRVWSNPSYSFDNFMASFLILFELTSQEGWIGVMETAQAVTGLGKQPVPKASLYQSFFFVVFSYIGGLIVSSLFVAVVVENYEKQSGAALMSPGQKRWMGMKKLLESTHMSKNHLRKSRSPTPDLEKSPSSDGVPSPYSIYYRLWDWVRCKDSWFPMVFDFLTVIIAIALMSEYARINNWELIKNGIFMAITILYMVENYIKIKGLGWTAYIWNRWNLYNGVMSALSLITTFLLICGLKWNPLAQAQKLLLTAILLRLIPRVTALNELLTTLAASFVSIASLFGVWLVVFAVYGIMFMEIFSLTSYGPNGGKNINFRRFGTTMLMMVRMSTGEGWNDIMHDFTVDHPDCISQPEDYLQSDCGSTPWAYSLFISFNVISMYIFTNMFIGVVMHNFSYVYDVDQGTKSPLNRKVLREFKEKWALVDVGATGYIEQRHILKFLMSLRGVFDMRSYQVPDPQNLDDDGDDDDFSVKRLKTLILKPELPKGPKEYLDLKLEDLKPLQLIKKIDKEKVKEIQRRRKMLNIIYVEIVRSMEPITTSEAKLSQKSFDWIRQIMNHGKDEKVSAGDENGRAGEGGKEGISFRKMLDIVARHKLVMDEQWFSVGGLIKHKQKMDEVHAILHALRGATFLTKTVLRRKFLKIYRYEQELNKGIKHSSEITSVGIAGINSTLSQEIEKLRSLLPNYIPEASLATLMKKLPKSPELSFDSTLKNLDSILESMKVTEEVPKPYNRRHFLKRFWNGLKKFLKEF